MKKHYLLILLLFIIHAPAQAIVSVSDIHLAEPGALIGFAGPRVIKQTIGQDLPEGFQRAQFQLDHGFVDSVVHRKAMRDTLIKILSFYFDSAEEANGS